MADTPTARESPLFPRDVTEIAKPPREVDATLDELGADGCVVSTQKGRCLIQPFGSAAITIGSSVSIFTHGDDMPHGTQKIERMEEHEGGVYMLHDSSGRVFRFVVHTAAERERKQASVLERLWRLLST
jgi:hypothetical protein